MKPDELIGEPVITASGQIGFIIGSELEKDKVHIQFLKIGYGTFSPDELFQLKPFDEISRNLERHQSSLSIADYKTLFQISLLKGFEQTIGNIATALSIAQTDVVRDLSLRTLKDALHQSQSLGR